MGLCNQAQTQQDVEETIHHKEIEKNLKTVKKSELEIRKLLLLGAGSSGKSTLFRQLKCVFRDGFTTEIEETVPIIRRNCIAGIIILLKKSQELYDIDNKENVDCFIDLQREDIILSIQNIVNYRKDTFESFENDNIIEEYRNKNDNDDTIDDYMENKIQKLKDELYGLGEDINFIWNLPQIQSTYNKRRTYQYSLPDNREHFFNKLSSIFSWGYTATTDDILKCRIRTTGLVHDKYITKDMVFTITDVGGQRNERKKWIHGFEGVTAVIFVAALNHYASVLFEDELKNAMIESIELFTEIINSKWFKKTEIILFLNKDDLFRECIENDIPLNLCFHEKNGAIWKKEYVDDSNYYPKDKKEKPKIYSNYTEKEAKTVNNINNNNTQNNINNNNAKYNELNSLQRVHLESESLSFSQSQDTTISRDEYHRRCAIYPKSNLIYLNKEIYESNKWCNKTDEEWFNYIYMDYLNFITEMYLSMNQQRGIKRIFVHVVTATDGDNVSKVFWDVQNIVIRSNLLRGGLM